MKVLLLYDYPPSPSGLATQGDLLYQGLTEIGVDVQPGVAVPVHGFDKLEELTTH